MNEKINTPEFKTRFYINTYSEKLRAYSKFKVGITGNSIEERFKNGYSEEYDEIKKIYSSSSKEHIIKLEKCFIAEFKKHKHIYFNCENINDGGAGPVAEDSEEYILYLVYKK